MAIHPLHVPKGKPRPAFRVSCGALVLPAEGDKASFSGNATRIAEHLQYAYLLRSVAILDNAFANDHLRHGVRHVTERRTVPSLHTALDAGIRRSEFFDEGASFHELAQFGLAGGPDFRTMKTTVGTIEIFVLDYQVIKGSAYLVRTLRFVFPKALDWRGITYGALLSFMIGQYASNTPQSEDIVVGEPNLHKDYPPIERDTASVYVCTIGAVVVGEPSDIVHAGIMELTVSNDDTNPWFARQQCLHVAGYYNGLVDGVYGPLTAAAEKAYSAAHGNVQINWRSHNFARHVLMQASRAVSTKTD